MVEDLNSKNGILVNQKRRARALLRSGDIISFGQVDVVFYLERKRSGKAITRAAMEDKDKSHGGRRRRHRQATGHAARAEGDDGDTRRPVRAVLAGLWLRRRWPADLGRVLLRGRPPRRCPPVRSGTQRASSGRRRAPPDMLVPRPHTTTSRVCSRISRSVTMFVFLM